MRLLTESYVAQAARWPTSGHHLLAQYDAATVIVYQAYQPSIGRYAATHGVFGGGGFSFQRMSWIKPGFLWMMYRSGWGTKPGQEVTLAIQLQRAAFERAIQAAAPSSFAAGEYADVAAWRAAVAQAEARLQWDPDHDPSGAPLARRALQLGLRGSLLASYANEWISEIEDISSFVAEQREHASAPYGDLLTPREEVMLA